MELNTNKNPYYFFNRGTSLNALEKYEEAIKDFDMAIKLDPEDPDHFNRRGTSLDSLSKNEEAIKDIRKTNIKVMGRMLISMIWMINFYCSRSVYLF